MSEQRCKEEVRDTGTPWPRWHQCSRKAVKDGFCTQHHPDTVAKRKEQLNENYLKKMERDPLRVAWAKIQEQRQEIDRLRAELAAHRWQPIATAPRDGTSVLLLSYIVPSESAAANGSKPFWTQGIGRALYADTWSGILGQSPQYWMPLPPPPKGDAPG